MPAESDSPGEATGNDEIGFWIWFESVADGWYSSWKNSSGPLSDVYAPDDYVCEEGEALYGPAKPYDYPALVDTSEYTDEKVSYEIDGISATTPNGGYMAIDGETTQYILISAFLGLTLTGLRSNRRPFDIAELQLDPETGGIAGHDRSIHDQPHTRERTKRCHQIFGDRTAVVHLAHGVGRNRHAKPAFARCESNIWQRTTNLRVGGPILGKHMILDLIHQSCCCSGRRWRCGGRGGLNPCIRRCFQPSS